MLFSDRFIVEGEIDEPIREELDVFEPTDLESWDEMDDY